MDSYYDLEDPGDWPAAFPHLRELDQLFRCPVCKEYLDAPMVVTNCGHTFCSLCVRRCLTQETKCPSCRAPTTESELHPNRLVESLLREFRRGRPQLLSTIKTASKSQFAGRKRQRVAESTTDNNTPTLAQTLNKSAAHIDLTASDIENMDGLSDIEMDCDASKRDSPFAEDTDSDFVPETGSRSVTKRNTSKPSSKMSSTASVACPNCQQNVRQARINWHLDRCLAGLSTDDPLPVPTTTTTTDTQSSPPAAPTSTTATTKFQLPVLSSAKFSLPRPTKLAYSLLSEAKLRRTLRDLGIPSKGDKHQMQMRHVEWVNMYMANADSASPVSHRVLLKRLSTWEEALSRQSDAPKTQILSTPGEVAEHASKYAD
ncbi:E3 ubiquitin-protein ligase rad18, partial [Coemansia sp. RSA 2603]